jgi:proline dehydrogenase
MALVDKVVAGAVLPLVPKFIAKRFACRYVPGETLEDALAVVRMLNSLGMCASVDVLGEFSTSLNEAVSASEQYKKALEAIADENLDCNISVKPTHLGLRVNHEKCYELIKELCEKARQTSNFVRIDMEDTSTTQDTLDMYVRLRKEYDNVGTVVQAYLRRTLSDVRMLMSSDTNLRICKGVYVEPRKLAYKEMPIINDNYMAIVELMLSNGGYAGIATHDEVLVWRSLDLIEKLNPSQTKFEFQMLWGVDDELRDILLETGHKLRIYIPYGENWYAYSMRRLKENPRLAGSVFRAAFRR